MVPRVLNPASSAFLAQSMRVRPSVPGTALGKPIPISTPYLRKFAWLSRTARLSFHLSKHWGQAGPQPGRLSAFWRGPPEVGIERGEGGGELLEVRQVPGLGDERELGLRECPGEGLAVVGREDPVAVAPQHQDRDLDLAGLCQQV